MRVAITGHRPNKLDNDYDLKSPLIIVIKQQIMNILADYYVHSAGAEYQQLELISGMALGIDTLFVKIAIELEIPYIAAVPFQGQASIWPELSQKVYHYLLNNAKEVVVVSEGGYSPAKMQIRNEWMVDNADLLIAVWDGTSGGTANCIRYAESIGKEIIKINPVEIRAGLLV